MGMIHRLLLVSSVLVLTGSVVSAATLNSDCGFYARQSSKLHCSASNYLTRFGGHYCREFQALKPYFTRAGQGVLNCIRPCLIKALHRSDLTCKNAQKIAFASHATCYVQCGFCSMPLSDQLMIGAAIWPELFDPEFRPVMGEVSERCLIFDQKHSAPGSTRTFDAENEIKGQQ